MLSHQVLEDKPNCKKRDGGAWRAFVHRVARGGGAKADFRALGQRYRQEGLSGDADLKKLGDIGKAAAQHLDRRYGHTSFGPTRRIIARTSKQSKIEAFWARTKSWAPLARAHSIVTEHRENVDEALRYARQHSQLDGRAERRASEGPV